MSPAQQGRVGQLRYAAVEPVDQVVGIAPMRGDRTFRERTHSIAQPQRRRLASSEEPGRPPEVKHFALAAEHHRDHPGIAGQLPHRLGRNQLSGLARPQHLPRPQSVAQVGEGHRHHQRRLDPARRYAARSRRAAAYLDEGLAATALGWTRIAGSVWPRHGSRERADRGLQRRLALGVDDQPIGERAEHVADRAVQCDQTPGGILHFLEHSWVAELRQQRRPQPTDAPTPLLSTHLHEPVEHGGSRLVAQHGSQCLELGHHAEPHTHRNRAALDRRAHSRQLRKTTLLHQPGHLTRPFGGQ